MVPPFLFINMKKLLYLLSLTTLCLGMTACGGDDEDNGVVTPSNNTQQGNSSSDPEGTVVISMGSGAYSDFYDIGLEAKIHIDGNNNFVSETVLKEESWYYQGNGGYVKYDYYVEFASVGKVNGLGQVTSAPSNGWSKSIVVIPGTGYVARMMRRSHDSTSEGYYYGMFTRLYVAEQNVKVATVKIQTPFEVPFTLEKTSVALSHTTVSLWPGPGSYITGTTVIVNIINGTRDIKVAEKPEWCNVTLTNEGNARISADKNPDPQPRTGTVVLKNSVCSASITVTQDVAPPEE